MVKWYLSLYLVVVSLSCTRSNFTGDYKSVLPHSLTSEILVIDFTVSDYNAFEERYKYISETDLSFIHTYCINPIASSLTDRCIVEAGRKFDSELVVVCHNLTFHKGDLFDYKHDISVRTNQFGVARPSDAGTHKSNIFFDVYDAKSGELISQFNVSIKISGVIFKNRRDLGYTNINMTKVKLAINKAKKKGLNNIMKRLKDYTKD